jgi:hypothetical protein
MTQFSGPPPLRNSPAPLSYRPPEDAGNDNAVRFVCVCLAVWAGGVMVRHALFWGPTLLGRGGPFSTGGTPLWLAGLIALTELAGLVLVLIGALGRLRGSAGPLMVGGIICAATIVLNALVALVQIGGGGDALLLAWRLVSMLLPAAIPVIAIGVGASGRGR